MNFDENLSSRAKGPGAKGADEDDEPAESKSKFDYLLSMPLYSLTKDKVEELMAKIKAKQE